MGLSSEAAGISYEQIASLNILESIDYSLRYEYFFGFVSAG